jgi:putative transposase
MNLATAYANFYRSLKTGKGKWELPKFKKKRNHYDTYKTYGAKIDITEKFVKLPKVSPIRIRFSSIKPWYQTATPKSFTVSRVPSGKYFVSVLFDGPDDIVKPTEKREKVLGLDMSLSKFYVDNLGASPDYQRLYREN